MRILNLYSGIGGNRKLWGDDHEITAVEYDPKIAEIYQEFFPKDKVIVADAHQYLLDHFSEFDFIWSSPPCPTHSNWRKAASKEELKHDLQHYRKPVFPSMILYEEILFLQGYFKGKYCVENVIAWYKPLIPPFEIAKHYFWTNFYIHPIESKGRGMGKDESLENLYQLKGFDLTKFGGIDKMKTIRNCVEPETGLHIFEESMRQPNQMF